MLVVRVVSAPAVNGSDSSASPGRNGLSAGHAAPLPSYEVVKPSLGVAAAGCAPTWPPSWTAAHGTI